MLAASWFPGSFSAGRALAAAAGAVAVALTLSACGSTASTASAQASPSSNDTSASATSASPSASASPSLSATEVKYCTDMTALISDADSNLTAQQIVARWDTAAKEAPAAVHADLAQYDQMLHNIEGKGVSATADADQLAAIVVWDTNNCPSS